MVDFHDSLLWTMEKLSHRSVTIYSVFCDRPYSFMFFAKLADTHKYDVKPIDFSSGDYVEMDDAGINMHVVTYK